jgi:uncharacterized phiE125 gp8 family phage protein
VGLKIITPQTVTPISIVGLDALKQHLQEATDVSDEDQLITSYLNAAWKLAEAHTWRQFLVCSYRYTLMSFTAQQPELRYGRRLTNILIPKPPLRSIDSVKYLDGDGTQITLAANTDYFADLDSDIGSLWPAIGKSWPCVRRNHPAAVEITFTAGYGNTLADMPDVLLHALRLQLASWWRNRESVDTRQQYELPNASKALLEAIEVRDDRLITDEI